MTIAESFDQSCRDAGLPITGVSIGDATDTSTWTVQPTSLQGAAQAVINAVDLGADAVAEHWAALRAQRTRLLLASDWTQLADTPLSAEATGDWQVYRQTLRDVPANTADPLTPTWPTAPAQWTQ